MILSGGQGTLVDIAHWDKGEFENCILEHPKAVIRFADAPVLAG